MSSEYLFLFWSMLEENDTQCSIKKEEKKISQD